MCCCSYSRPPVATGFDKAVFDDSGEDCVVITVGADRGVRRANATSLQPQRAQASGQLHGSRVHEPAKQAAGNREVRAVQTMQHKVTAAVYTYDSVKNRVMCDIQGDVLTFRTRTHQCRVAGLAIPAGCSAQRTSALSAACQYSPMSLIKKPHSKPQSALYAAQITVICRQQ